MTNQNNQLIQALLATAVAGPTISNPLKLKPDLSRLPAHMVDLLNKPLSYFQGLAKEPAKRAELLTHVAYILDESSSMAHVKEETLAGYLKQIQSLKEGAAEAGDTTVTFTKFNTNPEVAFVCKPVDQAPLLTSQTYNPNGCTALYDAIGLTLEQLLLQADIFDTNCATLVTVFTDGEENSSNKYSAEMLKDLITKLEATGLWTFAIIGPAGAVSNLGQMLAVKPLNVTGYNPSSKQETVMAFSTMQAAGSKYMSMRSVGATQSMDLFEDLEKFRK